jgi:hypothetical protein
MKLLQALRNSVNRLDASLKDSDLFRHSGDKGEFRERILEDFLRPFLPPCYGLGSGAVFSADGGESSQIDVVIYDSVFSNVLFRDRSNSLFPCESVFGLIEVKSELTSAELEISVANVASVKRLARQPSDMCDLLPFRRLGVGGGLEYDTQTRNPYVGFVFAYGGLVAETALVDLNNRLVNASPSEKQLLPDFVFNHTRGYMILRTRIASGGLQPVPPGQPFDCFGKVMSGTDTLPLFFLTANICLNQIILKAPDLNAYWQEVLKASTAIPK